MASRAIAIIGIGNLGEALVRGLLATTPEPLRIIAADVRPERLDFASATFGIATTADAADAVREAAVVLLAVKPQDMRRLLEHIRGVISPDKLVISVAAGITTRQIEDGLGEGARVIRTMPNTPGQIGAAATALCRGRFATEADLATAIRILGSIGLTIPTDEHLMDAVTGLSGTGPAYVFLVAEAMIRGGIAAGLDPDMARKLAIQTVLGAGRLMAESEEEPAELRRRVTSPGGTTAAALKVMEERGLSQAFVDAILAATRRSRELSGS
jgi:pyrroline-5-carboxylate reductase